MTRLFGHELKVGDTIEVWWSPKRDTIVALRPYDGPLDFGPDGAQLADFALNTVGMTIQGDALFTLINRPGKQS